MFIKADSPVYQKIAHAIEKVILASGGAENLRKMYQNQSKTRLVWDVFWATNEGTDSAHDLYCLGCNDNHIETMLRRICKQHGLIQEQPQ